MSSLELLEYNWSTLIFEFILSRKFDSFSISEENKLKVDTVFDAK